MNYNSETINKLYYGDRLINISVTNGSGGDNALIKSIKIEDFTGTTFNRSTSYITSVTIPNSVTSISDYAFQFCTSLSSLTIPSGVTSIGSYAFSNCSGLTSVTIPDGVTSIGSSAFINCKGLSSVTIPSGITTINSNLFSGCISLTSVTIPSGVTSISNFAFQNCSGLTSVTIEAITPPTLGITVFASTNNCPIYVPSESVETYKSKSGWSSYASRIQAIP